MTETNQTDPNTNDIAEPAADSLEPTQPVSVPMRAPTPEEIDMLNSPRGVELASQGLEAFEVIWQIEREIAADAEKSQQQAAATIVETHEQAAAINVERSAEDGYVKVGDQVPA